MYFLIHEMITNEHINKLQERLSNLKTYLDIDKKKIEISNEEEKTANPNFWNNPREAEIVMKNLRLEKKWVEDFENASTNFEDVTVLYEFYLEDEVSEKEVENKYNLTINY